MLQLTVEKEQSLKEFTENNYAQASFFWDILLKEKSIKVNGKRVGRNVPLYRGDTVYYYLSPKRAEKPAFYVVYEDENILVADKESGVNSEAVFAALQREKECYFVHRLDRNTKGLLAFAKTKAAEEELLKAFKNRLVEKKYHALCFGVFAAERETLTAYLKKDEDSALVKVYGKPVFGSEKIITEYRVLQRLEKTTKVEVTLHTGKTHQIRAHLAHIGCPIVGDMKYGNTEQNRQLKIARQRLVSKKVTFFVDGTLAYLYGREFISRFEME